MTAVSLIVNGDYIRADVAPRTHLADFLREQRLLTGTHLGCEHGVCGACTLLIDDAPARSCIAFAAACEGARVTTIEGLENDPLMIRLRAAFTAEHALQCGYCTPGMLVTARDIVLRLPDADEARIRLELAGNLCRCTGYAGIVRAIRRVLLETPAAAVTRLAPLPKISSPPPLRPDTRNVEQAVAHRASNGSTRVEQQLRLSLPRDAVWEALQDPALVAGCIPGASLTGVDGSRVSGAMETALGPIRARFTGAATLTYADDFTGQIAGDGQDGATRLSGQARFAVAADGADASTLDLSIDYALRGPLAQFARGAVVQDFATEIAGLFARNLEAMLQGRTVAPARRLGLLGLLWRVLRRRFGMTAR
jgi:carbon-monoxide dehydrogenase small subunit